MSEPLTFWDHLDELRSSLLRMLGVTVLFAIIAFVLKDELFAIVLAPRSVTFSLIACWALRTSSST